MDLALALGRDVRSMPEREFVRWRTYFRRKGFPLRRLEYHFALMSSMLAAALASIGVSELPPISDYLFNPNRDDDGNLTDYTEEDELDAAKQAFQFKPRK